MGSASPCFREAFELLKTTDFEVVIDALRQAVTLLPLYEDDATAKRRMEEHAVALKGLLVQAIAGRHPERPGDITDEQYRTCRRFLMHFAGKSRKTSKDLRGHIYSLNYDLLLYWTLLHTADEISMAATGSLRINREETEGIAHDDGFRSPANDPGAQYVTWDGEEALEQNLYYLHGALHLFDHGYELQKKCWERSGGTPLVDQVRSALDEGRFPLFVSEGNSNGKLERIRHSGYLHKGLRSFRGVCNVAKSTLFLFGHSLADNDAHILKQIEKGRCGKLYVSLYGDPNSETNQALINRARQIELRRDERNPLEIKFYDAESANVWGGNSSANSAMTDRRS